MKKEDLEAIEGQASYRYLFRMNIKLLIGFLLLVSVAKADIKSQLSKCLDAFDAVDSVETRNYHWDIELRSGCSVRNQRMIPNCWVQSASSYMDQLLKNALGEDFPHEVNEDHLYYYHLIQEAISKAGRKDANGNLIPVKIEPGGNLGFAMQIAKKYGIELKDESHYKLPEVYKRSGLRYLNEFINDLVEENKQLSQSELIEEIHKRLSQKLGGPPKQQDARKYRDYLVGKEQFSRSGIENSTTLTLKDVNDYLLETLGNKQLVNLSFGTHGKELRALTKNFDFEDIRPEGDPWSVHSVSVIGIQLDPANKNQIKSLLLENTAGETEHRGRFRMTWEQFARRWMDVSGP